MASLLLRWNIERTEQSQSSETVSQAGSFSNDSYGLSSYSFSAQGSDTVTQSSSDTYAWLLTGTDAGQETVSGPLEINGSGTFSETLTGGDSSGDTQTDSWSLTEGGSVSAGQLALSCYALSEEVSSSANSSASNSMTENDAGYAGTYVSMSVTHTFTYTTGGANHSASSDQSSTSSASLEEQGVYSNGSFDLSLVSYTGSGSATGSASDGDSGSWSGTSFSSSATDSAQSADSGSYSVSASGYYSNGSFSLSSYDLQGTSTDSWSQQATETDVEQLPGSGFHGSPTSTQTFSRSDTESSLETDTVYQTGAMTAGSYTNLSYSNVEDSVTSVTEHSLNTGYSTSDTWQTSAIETLGLSSGTAAGSSAYSFTEGSASGSGTNSVSSTLTWTAPGAVVNCMAPDASSVGFVSADASGGGAGVSTPELGVVDAAGEWLSGTNASAQEATEPESATPMVPPGAARGPLGDPPDQPGDKASKDRQNLLLGRQSTISCHAPQNNQPSSFDLSALKTPSKDPLKDLDKLIITTKKSPPKDFSRVTRNGIPSLSRRPPTLGKESPDQEYLTGKDVKILSTFASGHLGTALYVIGSLMDLAEGGGGGGEGDEFFPPGPGPGPRQATPKLPMQNGKPYGTPAPKSGTKVILNSPAGTQTAPAKFVRELKPGEKIADLVNEGKAISWTEGVESAVVSLEKTGAGKARRIVVTGGRDGIEFIERDGKLFMQIEGQEVQVNRVIGHTHPVATGPSQGDLDALNLLGQTRSYIVEIGGAESGAQIIRPK